MVAFLLACLCLSLHGQLGAIATITRAAFDFSSTVVLNIFICSAMKQCTAFKLDDNVASVKFTADADVARQVFVPVRASTNTPSLQEA